MVAKLWRVFSIIDFRTLWNAWLAELYDDVEASPTVLLHTATACVET